MPKTLILNQTNIVAGSGNSAFVYTFPQGGVVFKDQYIAVQQVSMYNSVFNVSASNNNNSFSYIWIDGTVVQVNMGNGYFNLPDINAYLQSVMYANKHYMLSGTNIIYFLTLVVNQSVYGYQINSYPINTTSTASYTLPVGATWTVPVTPATLSPQIVVPNTNFQTLIGFPAGTYPPAQLQGSVYSINSPNAPQINPQPSYLATCSLVLNPYSVPSNLLYSFTPAGVGFGELYVNQINDLAFNKIVDGTYNQFSFRFVDTLGNAINFLDPNFLILLVIRGKDEPF